MTIMQIMTDQRHKNNML